MEQINFISSKDMWILLWIVLLVIFLAFALRKGAVPLLHMPEFQSTKYKSPADYYYDFRASLGVFEGFTTPGVRYIKIVNTTQRAPNFIQIKNLQAFDSAGNNVALNKPATSRSVLIPSVKPGDAVDTNDANFYFSANTPNEFWMVDLGQEYILSKITYNSRPENSQFIVGYTMILLDANSQILEQFIFTSTDAVQTFVPMIAGSTGATGPAGATGPPGPAGTNGAAGEAGPAGTNGAAGAAGTNGADGLTGPAGPSGVDGSTGPTGPTGPTGMDGSTGPTGPTGPAGADGADGAAGADGADGADGTDAADAAVAGLERERGIYKGDNIGVYSGPNNTYVKGPNGNVVGVDSSIKIGGCSATEYGCCTDNVTAKSANGSNCPVPVGGCAGTQYGCCPDNFTARNATSSNCPVPAPAPSSCSTSMYGCCPDNMTVKNANGSNCSTYPPTPAPAPTPLVPTTRPTPAASPTSCSSSPYGCCPDNFTVKNASGSSCAPVQNANLPAYNTSTVFLSGPTKIKSACPEPQPCPPCGRCPEPSFDCKKVPNYSSTNSEFLPVPVLNDFSQFGM